MIPMEKSIVNKGSSPMAAWLRHQFFTRKLLSPFGFILMALVTLAMTYITVMVDSTVSVIIVAAFAAIVLCIVCILYPAFGFYFVYFISIFIVLPERIVNIQMPLGMVPEYMSYLVLLGIVTRQAYSHEIDHRLWTNSVTVWMIVLMAYYLLQLLNPSMWSTFGWFNFFRKQVSFVAFFYLSYAFFNSKKSIVTFTRIWIVICTIEALYACKQHWFGLFNFETNWLNSDETRLDLFVNWGLIRKFGLLSDPAAAGILYASATIFLVILGLRTLVPKKRAIYFFLAFINFLASGYTGTRTATMMIVAGVAFYCVLTLYERRTTVFMAVFAVLMAGIMVVPIYDSAVINRIRSTFQGSKDPSALVRDVNRKNIQPYVYAHPMGGGINTCGMQGAVYNPGHPLAGYPPDSGYMQIMMEQGPIGLALALIFYYVILRTGIKYFYRARDAEIKTLYVVHLVTIFTFLVAQFSQLAIGQYPSVLYLYSAFAILLKLHKYDSPQSEAIPT